MMHAAVSEGLPSQQLSFCLWILLCLWLSLCFLPGQSQGQHHQSHLSASAAVHWVLRQLRAPSAPSPGRKAAALLCLLCTMHSPGQHLLTANWRATNAVRCQKAHTIWQKKKGNKLGARRNTLNPTTPQRRLCTSQPPLRSPPPALGGPEMRGRLLLLLLLGFLLFLAPGASGEWDLSESMTCLQDRLELELPRELGNYTWHVRAVDVSGEEMMSCEHTVDYEKLLLSALLVNCTSLEHGQYQLRLLLLLNGTAGEERNVTYSAHCSAAHGDEIIAPLFVGETNCTKDSMAVTFPGPSLSDEHLVQVAVLTGTLTIDDGIKVHQLSLGEAMQHGYSFLADGHHLVFQAAFTATGVVSYKHNHKALYTAALKLMYGPPEHRLTVESRMLCVPGPVFCNTTHMTVAIPAFPGTLMAVAVEDETIPMDQLQDKGITLKTTVGVELHVSRRVLKSTLHGESCPRVQSYLSSLKLTFHFHEETVAMVMHPQCPCDQLTPIAAACTRDGYMDFEVLAGSTTPPLVLDTLRLRDPTCKPASRSPLNDRAWFHVPLSGCGTRYWLEGEKIMYENEVRALRSDSVLHRISRDSEFRLTVLCSFSNGDASVSVRVDNPPPLAASTNQGPLSLILLSYPEDSYRQPYHDDQYPIVSWMTVGQQHWKTQSHFHSGILLLMGVSMNRTVTGPYSIPWAMVSAIPTIARGWK
ncbi:zona pellucida sperm-binding protein 2 isoform X2 [Gallus gallus]|uniref:zona pellucida sperm-binding protein 2 isoform X2 n=1 Tax=Gallus gallus TaxID=9031 RepID=UPI001AE8CD5F|nr:zona pellucida sperm-binding protein 2 isoform X2 [Gallus gallus]